MYRRESSSGHTVEWDPEDKEKAAEAMVESDKTETKTKEEAKKGELEELDNETAQEVREIYEKKTDDKEAVE